MPTEEIDDDTPLRLKEAAMLAFPNGGMTVAGLRREAKRGRLVIERVAGKDYTTLNHIKRMRELCHVNSNPRDCGSGLSAVIRMAESNEPPGSSSIEVATSALESNLMTFKARKKL
jgi:hypothetical protein